MKIAFLGKGGSGKSTLATALVEHLVGSGSDVLAIDADHNMDLTYNLGIDPTLFFGTDPDLIKEYAGSTREDTYAAALARARERDLAFSFSPPDAYTASVSIEARPNLRIMTAGPHTDRVRSQEACSHSLAAPLKVYLPLLELRADEAVVIDERAGTDPVATGILASVDLAVIVRESTVHSTRVAEQIRTELELAGIPYCIVDNKNAGVAEDSRRAIKTILSKR